MSVAVCQPLFFVYLRICFPQQGLSYHISLALVNRFFRLPRFGFLPGADAYLTMDLVHLSMAFLRVDASTENACAYAYSVSE